MALAEKIEEKLKDEKYVNKIVDDFGWDPEIIEFSLVRQGTPVNYVRERYSSRGKHFYNKKQDVMIEMKKELKKSLHKDYRARLKKLIANKSATYYVEVDIKYYVPIQKAESLKKSVLKEKGYIKPAITPDLDNYDKLILDVLHDITYDDDKRLTKLKAEKLYSVNPRTEISVKMVVVDE